jgi:hypothetical protein
MKVSSQIRATEPFVDFPQGVSQDAEDEDAWSSEDYKQIDNVSEITQVRCFLCATYF